MKKEVWGFLLVALVVIVAVGYFISSDEINIRDLSLAPGFGFENNFTYCLHGSADCGYVPMCGDWNNFIFDYPCQTNDDCNTIKGETCNSAGYCVDPGEECDDGCLGGNQGICDQGDNGDGCDRYCNLEVTYIDVCTIQDLEEVRNNLAGNYKQICDIDFNFARWGGIGSEENPFTGIYDGNGFKIINMGYEEGDSKGLFEVSSGIIKNVRIENAFVYVFSTGGILTHTNKGTVKNSFVSGNLVDFNRNLAPYEGTGLLVGIADENSTILNSHSEGTINGYYNVGGLVGYKGRGAKIIDSSAKANVRGSEGGVGGLAGYSSDYPVTHERTIRNSFSEGEVQLISVDGSVGTAGGLVGVHSDGTIFDSYSNSNVINTVGNAGGLVGFELRGSIENSYATGNVLGGLQTGGLVGVIHDPSPFEYESRLSDSYALGNVTYIQHLENSWGNVGGLVGFTDSTRLEIIDTYSIGFISTTGRTGGVGGLIGHNRYLITDVRRSYWNKETSGQNRSPGGQGRTTEEMTSVPRPRNTYVNWDFANIWNQEDGEYPWLR